MKLVVGLGNPGKRYEKTRHNVGFMILDALHHQFQQYNISHWELSKKFNAHIAGCTIANEKVILAKPMTFMNQSGQAVQLIAHYYKMAVADLIIIHDDKDIPLGEIKIQRDRGHAGHNGIRSIMEHVRTQNFLRVRVGIASKNERKMDNVADFVLKKFSLGERRAVRNTIGLAVTEVQKLI